MLLRAQTLEKISRKKKTNNIHIQRLRYENIRLDYNPNRNINNAVTSKYDFQSPTRVHIKLVVHSENYFKWSSIIKVFRVDEPTVNKFREAEFKNDQSVKEQS